MFQELKTEMNETSEGPSFMDPVQGSMQGIINNPVKDIISDGNMPFLGNKTSEVRDRVRGLSETGGQGGSEI